MNTSSFLTIAFGALLVTGLVAPLPTFAAAGEVALGPQINLKAGQSFSGRFIHEHPVDGFDAPMRSEGRFTIDGSDKITWAIEKPMMTTTTITDAGLTQSVGNFTLLKVPVEKMPFLAEVQRNLLWALSGKWEKLKKDFTIAQHGNAQAWEVTITPKENSTTRKPFQKLVASGSQSFVEKAVVVLPSGVVDHLIFSDPAITP